jgi:hypothetical protein
MQYCYLICLHYFLINYFVINNRAFPLRLFHPFSKNRCISLYNQYKDIENQTLIINKKTEGEILIENLKEPITNIEPKVKGVIFRRNIISTLSSIFFLK